MTEEDVAWVRDRSGSQRDVYHTSQCRYVRNHNLKGPTPWDEFKEKYEVSEMEKCYVCDDRFSAISPQDTTPQKVLSYQTSRDELSGDDLVWVNTPDTLHLRMCHVVRAQDLRTLTWEKAQKVYSVEDLDDCRFCTEEDNSHIKALREAAKDG
jgi:hypothetical protein